MVGYGQTNFYLVRIAPRVETSTKIGLSNSCRLDLEDDKNWSISVVLNLKTTIRGCRPGLNSCRLQVQDGANSEAPALPLIVPRPQVHGSFGSDRQALLADRAQ